MLQIVVQKTISCSIERYKKFSAGYMAKQANEYILKFLVHPDIKGESVEFLGNQNSNITIGNTFWFEKQIFVLKKSWVENNIWVLKIFVNRFQVQGNN